MTVARDSQFSLQLSPADVRSATRAMLRAQPKYGSIEERPNGFGFLRTKGQEILLDVAIEPGPRGSRVTLTATSPPHVIGDVFGGYRLTLGELKKDIVTASESGARDDEPFTGTRAPADDRTLLQATFGLPPLAQVSDDRRARYQAARLILVAVIVAGIVLLPWFASHLIGLLVWLVVFVVAVSVERGFAAHRTPDSDSTTSSSGAP